MALHDSSVVLVVNHGETTFKFQWGGQTFPVPPAKHPTDGRMVSWLAVRTALGNPELIDHEDRNGNPVRDRTTEVARLNHRYGMCDRPFYTDDADMTTGDIEGPPGHTVSPYVPTILPGNDYRPAGHVADRYRYRHPNLPRLHVYDISETNPDGSARRVYMVLDDPENDGGETFVQNRTSVDLAAARLEAMEAEMAALRQQIMVQGSAVPNPAAGATPPTSGPPAPAPHVGPDAVPSVGVTVQGDDVEAAMAQADQLGEQVAANVDLDLIDPLDADVLAAFGKDKSALPTPPAGSTIPVKKVAPPPKKAGK